MPGREMIGLLPAGGLATRISPLPCSKEIYPVGFHDRGGIRPKPVCQYLLENFRQAGVSKAYFIVRPGKWDIPACLGDGSALGMHLGYLVLRLTYGVPFTLDQAYPFVRDAEIAMGFPDNIYQPANLFARLRARLTQTGADVVLGAFPTDKPNQASVIEYLPDGRVVRVEEKPRQTNLSEIFGCGVWAPAFTEFLHGHVARKAQSPDAAAAPEISVADVVQAAIDAGLRVEAEPFPDGSCLDIGTPEDLVRAVRDYAPG